MTVPVFSNGEWTCPEGYVFPKCKGCGHNFFEVKPEKSEHLVWANFLCKWCCEEQEST